MTYQKIKETLVDEKNQLSEKSFRNLATRLALLMLGLVLSFGVATFAIVGLAFTVIVIALAIMGYVWVFDLVISDALYLSKVIKVSKFWWVSYIFLGFVVGLLKVLRFL